MRSNGFICDKSKSTLLFKRKALSQTCLARLEDGSGFAVLPGRFQRHVAFSVSVKHSEEVVIGARHYDTDDKIKEGEVTERI